MPSTSQDPHPDPAVIRAEDLSKKCTCLGTRALKIETDTVLWLSSLAQKWRKIRLSTRLPGRRLIRLFRLSVFLTVSLMAHSLRVFSAHGEVTRGPYLSWVNDPQTTITVSWQTEEPESAIVEYGLDTTDTDTITSEGIDTSHSIEITGLEPSTTYYYRLGSDRRFQGFRTAVASGLPFTFCVFGDNRSDSAAHQRVVDRIVAIEPDFALNTGDLVASGSSMSDWNTFFNVERNLLSSIPFMPSIGNHDLPPAVYLELFHLPGDEKWYSFNYGNVHFISLDTEHDPLGDQKAWLESDLKSANADTAVNWIVISFHRPPYTKGKNNSDVRVREAWCDLFETHEVDLVFNGHNHLYQRTRPIGGVIYIVTGGGGAPLYDPGGESWIARTVKAYHCCRVSVDGLFIRIDTIGSDGTIFDSFAIRRVGARTGVPGISGYLYQNYPNPFSQLRSIRYRLPVKTRVSLKIHDIAGRLVETLVEGEKEPGNYSVSFDGKGLPAGTYFARFEAGEYESTERLILVR